MAFSIYKVWRYRHIFVALSEYMNLNNFELATHRFSFFSQTTKFNSRFSAFHNFFVLEIGILYIFFQHPQQIFFFYFRQFCEAHNRQYYKYNEFLDAVETYETADVAVLK